MERNNLDIFSQRLIEARKDLGLSQRALAAKLGISQGAYKGYELIGEKYGREPSLETLKNISAILDVSLDYLVGLED
jgi:transcriptional regulator with XRE-family HTH domain